MTNDDDIIDALRPLAGRSTAAEREGLTSDVQAMVAVFTIVRKPLMTKTTSRRKSIATMVAAGVIGFGGVAAAGPLGIDVLDSGPATTSTTSTTVEPEEPAPSTTLADEADTTTTSTTTAVTVAPTTTVESSPESTTTVEPGDDGDEIATELVDDPDTAFDETQCADGNHGKTVSSVAKATEGPNKGQTVRDAAQSSCGKKTDDADDADSDDDDADADDDDDADADDHEADDADDDDDDGDGDDDKSEAKGNKQSPKNSRGDDSASDDSGKTKAGNGNGNGKSKGKGK